jgi:carbamate kinase
MKGLAVIAVGGNSLIKDETRKTVADQYDCIKALAARIANVAATGRPVLVTHGNGPQVGFIHRRSELANEILNMHLVPLNSCVADSQGAIGYQFQQALGNEFKRRGGQQRAVTVITQVVVDPKDAAFEHPDKPIGDFYPKERAETMMARYPDWVMRDDSGRGYRRMVASPGPVEVVEEDVIGDLLEKGYVVIGAGGGGIPVARHGHELVPVDAVIDKDLTSAMLAKNLGAEMLVISTKVEHVCTHFGTPNEQALTDVDADTVRRYMGEGHFAPGSMKPKIKACLDFLDAGGNTAVITCADAFDNAVAGTGGTRIHKTFYQGA